MTNWCIAGDGWGRGEYPQSAWRPPQWIGDPENHRHHRTSGVHPGVSQFILQDNPMDNVSVLAGFSQNNGAQITRVAQYCQWWRQHLDDVRVLFFWSDPCRDYNPYNLWDENWHGVDRGAKDIYYILPTNRWEQTTPDEFLSDITELVEHQLTELNSIGVPIYLIGGSVTLPPVDWSLYPNLKPCIPSVKEMIWQDCGEMWWRPQHIIQSHALYLDHKPSPNPVDREFYIWVNDLTVDCWPARNDSRDISISDVMRWLPDGRHGGRQLHKMIWQEIQKHLKNT